MAMLALVTATATANAPRARPVAVIHGQAVTATDTAGLRAMIEEKMVEAYASSRFIRLSAEEVRTLAVHPRLEMLASEAPGADMQDAIKEALRRKILRELHQEYGGRMVRRGKALIPFDALREYLVGCEAASEFAIPDKTTRSEFWAFYSTVPEGVLVEEDDDSLVPRSSWPLESPPDGSMAIMLMNESSEPSNSSFDDEDQRIREAEEAREREEAAQREEEEQRAMEEQMASDLGSTSDEDSSNSDNGED